MMADLFSKQDEADNQRSTRETNKAAMAAQKQKAEEAAAREQAESAENRGSLFKPSGIVRPGAYVRGSGTSRKLGNKVNRCVKSVRQTVKARKGSNKESAAIAICTTSVLHPRGRTIKRYRKKRLITQKKFRGGADGMCS